MKAILNLSFSDEKGINCTACMLSFQRESITIARHWAQDLYARKRGAEKIAL